VDARPHDPELHVLVRAGQGAVLLGGEELIGQGWAPMSRTNRVAGKRAAAPRAPHVRSVIRLSRNGVA
jgi:hypothetical protein